MTTPVRSAIARRRTALAAAARVLAVAAPGALAQVVTELAGALECERLSLRGPEPTEVVARWVAPRLSIDEGHRDRWVLDVPLRVGGSLYGVLTATARHAFSADDAETLSSVGDVLALALAARRPAVDIGREVLDEEADRARIAATLLDTVGSAMVAVRYTADRVAAGQAAVAELDDPVRAALGAVRDAHRGLRAHALDAGLRAALAELAVRSGADRPDDGQPVLRLAVHAADPALDRVTPPVAVTLARTAETVLRGATGPATLRAFVDGAAVKLRVETADNAFDAGELVRWARRVSALGGVLRTGSSGVEVSLPAQPPAEGRHDHSPHL